MEIFCALLGVLYAYTRHSYALYALGFLFFMRPRAMLCLSFVLAFMYALWHQSGEIPQNVMHGNVSIKGHVVAVLHNNPEKTQFRFAIDSINGKPESFLTLLSWYQNAPKLQTGDAWQLKVKLKKPHNYHNPGGFDYERWLKARHIVSTGYVKGGLLLPRDKIPWLVKWQWMREQWGQIIAVRSPNASTAGIIQALTLGLTQQIEAPLWDLFRHTGTTHLMVISGAHIGLVAGLVFGVIGRFWRLSSAFCVRWPALKVSTLGGVIAAFIYAVIAGFAVPAERAFISLSFAASRFLGPRKFSTWQAWRYALLFGVLFEPHAVLSPGFYLSFLAVAILLIMHQRFRFKGIKNTLVLQLACLIGLMPLTLFWFSYGSFTGFIANLFAIPLVGFCIVPLALLTLLLIHCPWSWVLMKALGILIAILLYGLQWVDALSIINWTVSLHTFWQPLAWMIGIFLLLILPHKPFQLAGVMLLISALFPFYYQVPQEEARVRVLDVGQGLSVFVQTAKHTLLYDAGDAFFKGSDLGKLAIVPALQALGVTHIDTIIISHPDKDHYGGLASVESAFPEAKLIVNDPTYYKRGASCHEYKAWDWDGVHFQFFPIKVPFSGKNNTSCILQIKRAGARILLTGDIEKEAENYLVETYGQELQSEIVLVPHHGSKTSSTSLFLRTISPRYAIASIGFDNRFHFPHKKILQMYQSLHIPFYRTDISGMLTLDLSDRQEDLQPRAYVEKKGTIFSFNPADLKDT
jgi:competence protein ComEC